MVFNACNRWGLPGLPQGSAWVYRKHRRGAALCPDSRRGVYIRERLRYPHLTRSGGPRANKFSPIFAGSFLGLNNVSSIEERVGACVYKVGSLGLVLLRPLAKVRCHL